MQFADEMNIMFANIAQILIHSGVQLEAANIYKRILRKAYRLVTLK